MAVRGARCLAQWVLCVADAAARVPARAATRCWRRRCGRASSTAIGPTARGGSGTTCWLTGSRAGCIAIERLMRGNRLEGASATAAAADRTPASGRRRHRAERARPPVRGAGAQPEMGGGLHLHLDGRRLALCGGRPRPLLAPRGRLVDERDDDGAARHRRAGDGDLAARPSRTRCCITPIAAASTRASSSSG